MPAPMPWHRLLRLAGAVGLMVALFFVVPVSTDPHGGLALRSTVALAGLVALALLLGRQLVGHVRDLDRRGDGLVVSIVLVLLVFALGYHVLELHRPGQVVGIRTRLDALYLAASTMLTIGYGDAHPAGQAARALALAQMVFDVVFVTAAVRLLSARTAGARSQASGSGSARSRP